NLAKEKETDNPQNYESLSRTEETRLVRALYRFELYCNLLGASHYKFGRQRRLRFRNMDVLRIFLCMYEPWQVEEIICVYTFAKKVFDQIFNDIRGDLKFKISSFDSQSQFSLPFFFPRLLQ